MFNPIHSYVRVTLAVSAAALMLLPALGHAQQGAAKSGSDEAPVEEVVVTGIRASYQKAIDAKRNADSIIDAISAEDVGKFPDQNVAESLSHLPGLAVDRQFGEGEKVSILGTDPALNRVLINGQTVATSDWGGNPNDPTSRTFNYLLLSPQIIGMAEVYKSQEARLDEGSIGGTVIIQTRKPLDLEANTFAGSGGYTYNDRSRDGNVRGSVLYSWKNLDDTFGVLAAYTHDKEKLAQAGVEIFGYSNATDFPAGKLTGGNPATAIYPAGIDADYFQQTRQRDGVTLTLQSRPTDSLKFDLTGIYIYGKYDNYSQALFIYPAASAGNLLSGTINNGLVTSASLGDGSYTEHDADFRKSTVKTNSGTLTTEWDDGGPVTLRGVIGATKATGGKDPEYLLDMRANSAYSFSYSQYGATVNWAQPVTDAATFHRPAGEQVGGIGYYVTGDTEKYAQIDMTWKVDAGPFTKVLSGFKYTDHENYEDVQGSKVIVPDGTVLLGSQLDPGLTPNNLFDGMQAYGDLAHYASFGASAFENYDLAHASAYTEDTTQEFEIREKTSAAYVQGNFEGKLADKDYHGNVGMRFVHTSDLSTGYLVDGATGIPAPTPTSTTNTYNKLLPSANIAWDVMEDVIVRFGVAKVIARPRYSDLAQSFSRNDLQFSASGGNPNLKPYESVNYDATTEWYFRKGALVSAEFFYRDISQYVINVEHDQILFDPQKGVPLNYFVTAPINVQNAKVKGVALQLETPIAAGFGIATNWTYATADTPPVVVTTSAGVTSDRYYMPYLSKHTVNVVPYFERGRFSSRISYGFRSKYFTSIGRLAAKQFTDQFTELDAAASYNITKKLRLDFNAVNLLDEKYYQFDGVDAAPVAWYRNGRKYTAGVTYRF